MLEANSDNEIKTGWRRKLHRRLDAAGWGIFFVWIGVAFLADLGWGVGCIGVGAIILGKWAIWEYLSGADCRKTINSNC